MSTVAIMLVKDEIDVIRETVTHLLWHVDEVVVLDNGSTDGTREELLELPVDLRDDPEVAYLQSIKMTTLAREMFERGHRWVVPCDADEIWYPHWDDSGHRRVADVLDGVDRAYTFVESNIFNHVPSHEVTFPEGKEHTIFDSMPWRQRQHQSLGKVACRARLDLTIDQGNHGGSTSATALKTGGLALRHFPVRSLPQFLKKVRNGAAAYEAAGPQLPEHYGNHWRAWGRMSDEELNEVYETAYFSHDPDMDDSLVWDPALVRT